MKKAVFLLPFLLLSSCGKEPTYDKIFVPTIQNNTVVVDSNNDYLFEELTPEKLKKRLENKESFPLYVTAPGCGTCDVFSLTVKDYLRKTKAVLPHMQINAYLMVESLPEISDTSFLFIQEGEVIFSESKVTDEFGTTKELTAFLEQHTKTISVPDCSSYQLKYPLRTDFNAYTLLNTISSDEEKGIRSQFALEDMRRNQSRILFLNQESRNLTPRLAEYLYQNPDNLDGYCFVYDDIQSDTLKDLSLIEESGFEYAVVSYDNTEKGYSLSEIALES